MGTLDVTPTAEQPFPVWTELALTSALTEILRWPADAWTAGDTKYFILDVRTQDGATYLQCMADPGGDVLCCEIASGEFPNKPITQKPKKPAADLIRAAGYKKGRPAPANFQKLLPLSDEPAPNVLAKELVRLLRDALGYQGLGKLTLQVEHNEQARPKKKPRKTKA